MSDADVSPPEPALCIFVCREVAEWHQALLDAAKAPRHHALPVLDHPTLQPVLEALAVAGFTVNTVAALGLGTFDPATQYRDGGCIHPVGSHPLTLALSTYFGRATSRPMHPNEYCVEEGFSTTSIAYLGKLEHLTDDFTTNLEGTRQATGLITGESWADLSIASLRALAGMPPRVLRDVSVDARSDVVVDAHGGEVAFEELVDPLGILTIDGHGRECALILPSVNVCARPPRDDRPPKEQHSVACQVGDICFRARWRAADQHSTQTINARIVFINSCLSLKIEDSPFTHSSSLALSFYRRAAAVVATRWVGTDALVASRTFEQTLTSGRSIGEAVRMANTRIDTSYVEIGRFGLLGDPAWIPRPRLHLNDEEVGADLVHNTNTDSITRSSVEEADARVVMSRDGLLRELLDTEVPAAQSLTGLTTLGLALFGSRVRRYQQQLEKLSVQIIAALEAENFSEAKDLLSTLRDQRTALEADVVDHLLTATRENMFFHLGYLGRLLKLTESSTSCVWCSRESAVRHSLRSVTQPEFERIFDMCASCGETYEAPSRETIRPTLRLNHFGNDTLSYNLSVRNVSDLQLTAHVGFTHAVETLWGTSSEQRHTLLLGRKETCHLDLPGHVLPNAVPDRHRPRCFIVCRGDIYVISGATWLPVRANGMQWLA